MEAYCIKFNGMPISVNSMTMIRHGHKVNTVKYREFKNRLTKLLKPWAGKFKNWKYFNVWIAVQPDTKRAFDIDNVNKSVYDSFTAAGIWEDDSQVINCISTKMPKGKTSRTAVLIWEASYDDVIIDISNQKIVETIEEPIEEKKPRAKRRKRTSKLLFSEDSEV